jgi:choline kinase
MTRGLLLAAGRGRRMGGLTDEKPKCFAPLHGRRLFDWQLQALQTAGIEPVALVRGYRADAFTEPLRYFDNPGWATSNMVRTLLSADEWLSADACIVSYSDIVYTAETVTALAAKEGDVVVAYDPQWLSLWSKRFANPLLDAESFRLDGAGRLQTIGERCATTAEIQGQYMGLLKITPQGWGKIVSLLQGLGDDVVDRLDMTGLLRRGIAAGWQVEVSMVVGPWGEVDEPGDLALYERLFSADDLLGKTR